ncbi:hypothetical protein GGR51DRAFT_557054 [Nemania sp. FL0031]|nr:hypothetical protein GGR51DRAFT_557054 [Nemania sp. FL0031]
MVHAKLRMRLYELRWDKWPVWPVWPGWPGWPGCVRKPWLSPLNPIVMEDDNIKPHEEEEDDQEEQQVEEEEDVEVMIVDPPEINHEYAGRDNPARPASS